MENKIINGHTIILSLIENNLIENIELSEDVRNFIADLRDVDIEVLEIIKKNLTKFANTVLVNKGSFVVVSNISFDEKLNIVPTLQEAQDFIEMEEIERQLEF
jgi:hypothetical protein|tara:strand:- start:5405 stop:5713 length:309 start_codon:yes stop_codon:yes gene_type:complete